jgi:hypothetical protein
MVERRRVEAGALGRVPKDRLRQLLGGFVTAMHVPSLPDQAVAAAEARPSSAAAISAAVGRR